MPEISIIVPVYNVENYLSRCLDSVLTQKYENWECILVDDGSTDRSGLICDEYSARDSRFISFHKPNGGVSSARNLGLNNVRGKWVYFLDSDDYLSDDFLLIPDEFRQYDIVQKGYRIIDTISGSEKEQNVKNASLDSRRSIDYFFVNYRNNPLWDKIIRTSLVKDVFFDENISIGEDLIFFLHIIKRVRLYAFSDVGKYNYVKRVCSAMWKINQQKEESLRVDQENIRNVENCLDGKEWDDLRNGIIYGTYINKFLGDCKMLSDYQRILLSDYLQKMTCHKLKLLSIKRKIKLILKALAYKIR